MKRTLALILVLVLAMSLLLPACTQTPANNTTGSTPPATTVGKKPSGPEYQEPLQDGYNQVTFYWSYPGDNYENCDMWIWWGDVAGKGYVFHECNYGAKVVVNVPEGISEVGFIVRRDCSEPGGSSWGSATKDYEQDRFAVIEGKETSFT